MRQDGLPLRRDQMDSKINFFRGVERAILTGSSSTIQRFTLIGTKRAAIGGAMPDMPREMARHDKVQGAACLFRHCDQDTVQSILDDAGLSDLRAEHEDEARLWAQMSEFSQVPGKGRP